MNLFVNKVLRFLAYSNLWVALSVVSLTWYTGFILQYNNVSYLAFCFFATLGFYSYSRFYQGATLSDGNSKITKWQRGKKPLLIIVIAICLTAALYFSQNFSSQTWGLLVLCGAISLIYPLPYILGRWPGVRHIPGFKLFIIAFVWTIITFVIPAIELQFTWDKHLWNLTVQRFLIITAITIPFDVRDKEIDHPDIHTLPMRVGSKPALLLGVLAIFGVEISILLQYLNHQMYSGITTIALLIGLEIMMVLIHRAFPVKNDLYYSFWIEGTPIYLAAILFLSSLL